MADVSVLPRVQRVETLVRIKHNRFALDLDDKQPRSACFRCDRKLDLQRLKSFVCITPAPICKYPPTCKSSNDLVVCHPFWQDDLICGNCAATAKRCVVCERPTRGWSEPWLALATSPGREAFFLCHCCYSTGVARSEKDLVSIIQDVVQFFAQHPQLQIDLPSYFNIVAGIPSATYRVPLRGVELNNTINPTAVHKGSTGTMPNCSTKILPLLRIQYTDLHSLCFKSCNVPKSQATTFVSGWSEDLVFGRFQLQTNSSSSRCISKLSLPKSVSMRCPAFTQSVATSSFTSPPCFLTPSCTASYHNAADASPSAPVYTIQLCHKLQKDTLASVLAHELFHALISFSGVSLNLDFEEALCNAVSVLFLQDQAQKLLTTTCRSSADNDRINICQFRCRRLLVGDTPSTRQLPEAINFIKEKKWQQHVGFLH